MRNAPVSRAALANYSADLMRLLVSCEGDLPHAGNGKPVPSGDPYADDVLKSMKSEKSQEIKRLVAVLLAFLNRGTKRATVRLFTQRLDAIIATFGQDDASRPLRILNRREQREDGMFDMAQLRLEADTEDTDALEGIVRQGAHYKAALEELIEEAQGRLVVLRAQSPAPRLALVRDQA